MENSTSLNPLYRSDTYLAETQTAIAKITLTDDNETAFICRDLAFYPGGGGQPAETTGTVSLRGQIYQVRKLMKEQGDVFIVLNERLPFHEELRKGEPILQLVDMGYRLHASKLHSLQHTLGAAIRLVAPSCETLGMQIRSDLAQCEVRFQPPFALTEGMAEEVTGLARMAIASDLPIRAEFNESVEAARTLYGETFRIAPSLTEWRSNRLRTIVIGDERSPIQDVCFCGGTHIKSLAEAGDFEIRDYGTDAENGEGYLAFRLK